MPSINDCLHSLSTSTVQIIRMIIYGQNHLLWNYSAGQILSLGTFTFILMSQTLLIVIRNLKLYKNSIASGMNEDFFSQFFLMVNLIFSYGTPGSR